VDTRTGPATSQRKLVRRQPPIIVPNRF
jgi:hypothetical protein